MLLCSPRGLVKKLGSYTEYQLGSSFASIKESPLIKNFYKNGINEYSSKIFSLFYTSRYFIYHYKLFVFYQSSDLWYYMYNSEGKKLLITRWKNQYLLEGVLSFCLSIKKKNVVIHIQCTLYSVHSIHLC